MNRDELTQQWFALTREEMPAAAKANGWPVYLDHCFQRILLDHVAGGPWRKTIAAPAYRHATDRQLAEAIAMGKAALDGKADLAALNIQSLKWRGKM